MPADVLDAVVLSMGATAEQARWWADAWERAMGAGDAPPTPAANTTPRERPYLLPPTRSRFVGRLAETQTARRLLLDPDERPATLIVIGPAGAGKTAFAVRIGHTLAEQFPDGQLYADLTGAGPDHADPATVLGAFLRAMGVPTPAIPADMTDRVHLYRTMLARRRMLVVLDNAADARQVYDLLPNGASCACIVTSRTYLPELDGRRLPLDTLPAPEALNLLRNMVGEQRVEAEPEAASEIIEQCGRLPLAVWVIGARLAARPHWSLRSMVRSLADERRRLDELTVGDVAVRASVELSYRSLTVQAQQALRMLSLFALPDFAPWAMAALLDSEVSLAEKLLDELVEFHLVEAQAGTDGGPRYRLHDLVRLYGNEQSHLADESRERDAARLRLLSAAIHLIQTVDAHLTADFQAMNHGVLHWTLPATEGERLLLEPLTWFDEERRFLVSVAEQSLPTPAVALGAGLAVALTSFFRIRSHFDDWHRLQSRALSFAEASGDQQSVSKLHRSLGKLATILDRYPEAIDHYEQALRSVSPDDPEYAAGCTGLAYAYRLTGRYREAADYFERAAAIATAHGPLDSLIYALNGLGVLELDQRRPELARDRFTRCLDLSRSAGYRPSEAQALRCLGHVHRELGDYPQAAYLYDQARELSTDLGDHLAVAHSALWLGDAYVHTGRPGPGRRLIAESLWRFRADGNLWGEAAALNRLAAAQLAAGRPTRARPRAEAAVAIWRQIASPSWLAQGLDTLAEAQLQCGLDAEATTAEAAQIRADLAG